MHVTESIDAQNAHIARHQQHELNKAGNHMPRFAIKDGRDEIDRIATDQSQNQDMVSCSLEDSDDGRKGFPSGIGKKLGRVEECQVSGGEEDVSLDACKEDKTQNEQVERLPIFSARKLNSEKD